MKQIERLIQFAEKNGFDLLTFTFPDTVFQDDRAFYKIYSAKYIEITPLYKKGLSSDKSIVDICISKSFIMSLTRWLIKDCEEYNFIWSWKKWMYWSIDIQWYLDNGDKKWIYNELVKAIAFAIIENELEKFIDNILPKE